MAIHTYKVRLRGVYTTWKVDALTKDGAIKQVWNDIKKGYQYGVESLTDLRKKAIVKRLS